MKKMLTALIFSLTAKNIYWVFAGNFSIVLSGFVFLFFTARSLGPAGLGTFSTITSLILILSDLGELGIGGGLANFLPRFLKKKDYTNANKVLKTSFTIQVVVSTIVCLLLIIFSKHISRLLLHTDAFGDILLVSFSSLGVFGFMLYNFTVSKITANEKFKRTFIVYNLFSLPKLIIITLLFFLVKIDIFIVLLIFILGPYLAFIFDLITSSSEYLRISGYFPVKKIFNFSIFLAANKLFVTFFSRLDILMLSSLANTYESGLYSAASKVSFLFPLIGGSLGTVIAPKYSRLAIDESKQFSKKVYLMVMLLIILVILSVLISPWVISLAYGKLYLESIELLQLLLLTTIPFLLSIPLNNLIIYTFKKPHILAFSSLVQLLIIYILNILLIPKIGRYGPAISIGIASSTALIISLICVTYLYKKNEK